MDNYEAVHKRRPQPGRRGLSSADILLTRREGVFRFSVKIIGFFEIYGVSMRTRGRGCQIFVILNERPLWTASYAPRKLFQKRIKKRLKNESHNWSIKFAAYLEQVVQCDHWGFLEYSSQMITCDLQIHFLPLCLSTTTWNNF